MPTGPTDDVTLRTLEFDRIVAAVCSFALTPLGRAAAAGLLPMTDPELVARDLRATSETLEYLDANHPLPLEAPDDIEATLAALAIDGRPLDPGQLVGLARLLFSVGATANAIRSATPASNDDAWPLLNAAVEGLPEFEREVANIERRITPQGDVADDATPRLAAIRQQLQRQRQRLRGTLGSYLRGRETAKYLQEHVVTERAGRFVLVVRAEHRGAIPGIIHGSSGSGASLFLEPLSTVDINNEIVALEEEERQEVHRVLLDLSNALRARALELRRTLEAAAEIDVMQARARFSKLVAGVEPALVSDVRIELPAARHPLLMRAVVDRSDADDGAGRAEAEELSAFAGPVPVDISVTPPTGALVVTGPNTGGKTVALKTAGLLAMMAQAGLHVPAARGAALPVFRSIFADIGDEQSIANSLSTFSGHIAHTVAMDGRLRKPALVLLDEVGAGTDPAEGGALGAAIVEHFRRRGAIVLATTHDDTLKSYAATADGVACAGFGFDPETYAPTYRLTYGSPGRSLALEIASRLGIAASIVEDARARRSAREAQLADHLAQVERDLATVSRERDALAADRLAIEQQRDRLVSAERALGEREAQVKERLRNGVNEEVRRARKEIDAIVDDLQKRAAILGKQAARRGPSALRLSTGHTGQLRKQAVEALEAIAPRHAGAGVRAPVKESAATTRSATQENRAAQADDATQATSGSTPEVGSRVRVASLRLDGILAAVNGNDAEVEALGKRIHVRVGDVRSLEIADAVRPAPHASQAAAPRGGGVTVNVAEASTPPLELNVIGCRVDDALARVEKYVDRAMLHERRELRVIHGHGTGQLRRAIGRYLGEHPLVERYAPAEPEHGGGGVTVISLKE